MSPVQKIRISVTYIVGYDDSTIRMHLECICKDCDCSEPTLVYPRYPGGLNKVDRGRLPIEIPDMVWLSNTTHCTKVATSPKKCRAEENRKVNHQCVSNIDSFIKSMRATIEHLFKKTQFLWRMVHAQENYLPLKKRQDYNNNNTNGKGENSRDIKENRNTPTTFFWFNKLYKGIYEVIQNILEPYIKGIKWKRCFMIFTWKLMRRSAHLLWNKNLSRITIAPNCH